MSKGFSNDFLKIKPNETWVEHSANAMLKGSMASHTFVFGSLITFLGQEISALTLPNLIQGQLSINKFGGSATITDIATGGAGITVEQARAPTATPKISIWPPTHWNIVASTTRKEVPDFAAAISDLYELTFWVYLARGSGSWWSAWGWWNFYVAYEWYAGWDWIDNDSERIWNNIIGSDLVANAIPFLRLLIRNMKNRPLSILTKKAVPRSSERLF